MARKSRLIMRCDLVFARCAPEVQESGVQCWAAIQRIENLKPEGRSYRDKNVTIFSLPCLCQGLHIVYPTGRPRYYLLLTGIHRLLAALFTSIRILFEL